MKTSKQKQSIFPVISPEVSNSDLFSSGFHKAGKRGGGGAVSACVLAGFSVCPCTIVGVSPAVSKRHDEVIVTGLNMSLIWELRAGFGFSTQKGSCRYNHLDSL